MKKSMMIATLLLATACGPQKKDKKDDPAPATGDQAAQTTGTATSGTGSDNATGVEASNTQAGDNDLTVNLLNHFQFASTVTNAHKQFILNDFRRLANWNEATQSADMQKLGKLIAVPEINATVMAQWAIDRLTYFYPDEADFDFGLVVPGEKRVYEFSIPGGGNSSTLAASNVGGSLWSIYLQEITYGVSGSVFKFNDNYIPLLSPRTGVMKVGPGLFGSDDTTNTDPGHQLAKSLFRLNVILHEARHGDGNSAANTLSFAHVNCPNDASFPAEIRGIPACDSFWNGAYNVGGQVLASMQHLCDDSCSARDKSTLDAIHLDTLSRVLVDDTAANYGDQTPEPALTATDIKDFELVPESDNGG